MGLQTNSRLAAHYHLMRRIRKFEERVGELFVRGLSSLKDIDQLRGLLKMLGPKAPDSPDTVINAMLQDLSRGRLTALVEQLLDGSSS